MTLTAPQLEQIRRLCTPYDRVVATEFPLAETFLETAARFAGQAGTVLLMSGGQLDSARCHLLGFDPLITFTGRGRALQLTCGQASVSLEGSPLDVLEALTASLKVHRNSDGGALETGLMGYLAYDLKDDLERLPRTVVDDQMLPHILFYLPSMLLVHDRETGATRLCMLLSAKDSAEERRHRLEDLLAAPRHPGEQGDFTGAGSFRSGFDRGDYMAAVARIRRYIAAGDVYQVNMSQRFEMAFEGDPFSLFRSLYRKNPAPFFAYINGGDHQVVSTSPERFVSLDSGVVEARPIKGTRPRGRTPEEDRRNREALRESPKDDAELSMIVDLLRNDIGKVCRAGSVTVTHHRRLEAYRNVYHLVSVVNGELDDDKNAVDLIRATFPGGSITGCPKIRSMEIIDELEPVSRHIYTGSIGYIGLHGTMDLSIAIRTATITDGRIVFSVGGGIVYDSDPAEEYDETLHKGRTLFSVFEDRDTPAADDGRIWLNGRLQRASAGCIDHRDPGFLHGVGFFETLRADKGRVRMPGAHIRRFNRAWRCFFPEAPPDLTWGAIIRQVLRANHLENSTAVVKLLATAGPRNRPPYRRTLLVTAKAYTRRRALEQAGGLDLAVYPHPRQTPLADHKTTSYLYYLQAGDWARRQGAHEAIVLNPDGTISETNTANLLLVRGKRLLQPESPHVLCGTMEARVVELLTRQGRQLQRGPLNVADLLAADHVLVTNSLMGAATALHVDQKPLRRIKGLCRSLNQNLFDDEDGAV